MSQTWFKAFIKVGNRSVLPGGQNPLESRRMVPCSRAPQTSGATSKPSPCGFESLQKSELHPNTGPVTVYYGMADSESVIHALQQRETNLSVLGFFIPLLSFLIHSIGYEIPLGITVEEMVLITVLVQYY